jgi:uncharacterized membrane protein YccC
MNYKRIQKQIKNFFTGEYFTDALRITLSIIIPAGVLFALDLPQPAIGVAHGALLIALTDIRGTIEDKRTTSIVSIVLFFLVALLSILALPYPWLMGILFFSVTLACSMLMVYGSRFSIAGTAAIVLMVFIWGLKPTSFMFCVYLVMGGVWYYVISLLHLWIWPERYLRYAISECLGTTHDYLKVKALFYDIEIPLEYCYNQAILSHNRVSEAQQQLRSILLRDKELMNNSNRKGQALLFAAEKTIDLYEQITAIHYYYDFIRAEFAITGALDVIRQMVAHLTTDMQHISEMKPFSKQLPQNNTSERQLAHLTARFEYIIGKENQTNAAILSKLLANLKSIHADIQAIYKVLTDQNQPLPYQQDKPEYHHFAPFENMEIKQLWAHFKLSSPIFRFSLRLAITCLFGYILAQIFELGTYSYWILITIVVIIKPAFSLTRERNIQRLTGTLIGITIALFLLFYIQNTVILLLLGAVFLLTFFTFNRTRHLLSVIALTPMIILVLYIYGNSGWGFVLERIYDTLIGCAIAFAATYMFPSWESSRIPFLCRELLKANTHYLEKLLDAVSGRPLSRTSYKLARKSVYIEQANLSSAFQRMLGEPKHRVIASENIYHFQMLNHILSSNIASLFMSFSQKEISLYPLSDQSRMESVITALSQSELLLDKTNREYAGSADFESTDQVQDYTTEKHQDPFFVLNDIAREIRICCIEIRTALLSERSK